MLLYRRPGLRVAGMPPVPRRYAPPPPLDKHWSMRNRHGWSIWRRREQCHLSLRNVITRVHVSVSVALRLIAASCGPPRQPCCSGGGLCRASHWERRWQKLPKFRISTPYPARPRIFYILKANRSQAIVFLLFSVKEDDSARLTGRLTRCAAPGYIGGRSKMSFKIPIHIVNFG